MQDLFSETFLNVQKRSYSKPYRVTNYAAKTSTLTAIRTLFIEILSSISYPSFSRHLETAPIWRDRDTVNPKEVDRLKIDDLEAVSRKRNLDKNATSPISVIDPQWIMHATRHVQTTKQQRGQFAESSMLKVASWSQRFPRTGRSVARCIKSTRAWHLTGLRLCLGRISYLRIVCYAESKLHDQCAPKYLSNSV